MTTTIAPELLTENYDLGLGGPRSYQAWFDCGADTPIIVSVYQDKVAQKQFRWHAAAHMLTPAFLAGQAENKQYLTSLAKSDMTVRGAMQDWDDDDYLTACRDDAKLLAERAALILGAVRLNGKKK